MVAARNVLVVGAGIAGHTLACALHKRGIACEIVELKPDWQIPGTGMTIQGNALRAFLDIGVVQDIADSGWHREKNPIVFTDTLGDIVMEPEDRNIVGPGYPAMVAIRRAALHEVLQRATARTGVSIRMNTTIDRIDDGDDHVDVTFSDGSSGSYDLVVGCDGIRSRVRRLAFGEYEPQYSGFANWRAILPRPASVERMVWMWGHGRTIGILPVGNDLIYVAGVTKEPDTRRYPQEKLRDLFIEKFKGFGGVVPEVIRATSSADDWIYTVMEEVKLPPPWFIGRVVVLGDAAHASTPFWAQGASMAVEDCVVLAELLQSHERLQDALPAWQNRRFERCMFVQQGSYETGVQMHRDTESDGPRIFPPPVRDIIRKQAALRSAKLAEAI